LVEIGLAGMRNVSTMFLYRLRVRTVVQMRLNEIANVRWRFGLLRKQKLAVRTERWRVANFYHLKVGTFGYSDATGNVFDGI
jgi:hypothetical protein